MVSPGTLTKWKKNQDKLVVKPKLCDLGQKGIVHLVSRNAVKYMS